MELAAQRQDIGFAVKTLGISERRACGLLGVWRSSFRYRQKPDRNEKLREKLIELAHERPRFGYRRLGVLLCREGQHINHKRIFRVYRAAGLSVKRNRRKKLVRMGVSQPVLTAPNYEWSLDFLYDALATGRTVRVLSVVDNFTRECLALEVDSYSASQRVTRIFDNVIAQRGAPKALRMDNGLNASVFLIAGQSESEGPRGPRPVCEEAIFECRNAGGSHMKMDRAQHNEHKISEGALFTVL
jgi:putative transposase